MEQRSMLEREALEKIRRNIDGELRIDKISQILYSTDASIYQIKPIGVAFPRHLDDLQAIVQTCAEAKIPITARGSGSSLAGQAIGEGLIIDCSRYLDLLVSIKREERAAWVQPGLIINKLNDEANKLGLRFGPDPASAERASMGGSIANNASGAHSIVYGMAADHIQEVELVLADGTLALFHEQSITTAKRIAGMKTLEGAIYHAALEIRENSNQSIKNRWPLTWRRASGYNLNYLLPWSPSAPANWEPQHKDQRDYPPVKRDSINLAQLIAGSEGTLGIIRRIKVGLVPLPAITILVILAFEDSKAACRRVPELLEYSPTAVELIPQDLIQLASNVPAYAEQAALLKPLFGDGAQPPALLAIEFSGENRSDLLHKARSLEKIAPILIAETGKMQNQIWALRKVGLGLFMSRAGAERPWSFIEDLSVPVEKLGEFVEEIEKLFGTFGIRAEMYGHASAGCLHIRPLINLKTVDGIRQMRAIATEAVDLTLKLGGAISGEHGDGLARSEWNERMFGPDICAAFRQLKQAADPDNILNPGKIVAGARDDTPTRFDSDLRFAKNEPVQLWDPIFDFSKQAGLIGAIEQCNGAGVCRKQEGLMCPSFRATREELLSTRGRANLLRAYVYSQGTEQKELQKSVKEALDLCLACKGCKSECPSAVDIAKLKFEFMNDYHQAHVRDLRDYIFSYLEPVARLAQPIWFLSNPALKFLEVTGLQEKLLGISRERTLPRLAKQSLSRSWIKDRRNNLAIKGKSQTECGERVLFLSDPFTEFFYPELGLKALEVLRLVGCHVQVLPIIGSGRMMISKGFLKPAKKRAAELHDAITAADPSGKIPVIGLEPSETVTLMDEYQDFLPGRVGVAELAERTWSVEEFLLRNVSLQDKNGTGKIEGSHNHIMRVAIISQFFHSQSISSQNTEVFLHEHCFQQSRPPSSDGLPVGAKASSEVLKRLGYSVQILNSGCCGMAGAFGYEKEHYEISMKVGEDRLFDIIRNAETNAIICASGYSCRAQIEDGTGRKAYHPIEIVYQRLTEKTA